MPTSTSLWAFTALAFALIIVPGPSVMFVIGRAITFGRRAALFTVAGNAAGMFAQVRHRRRLTEVFDHNGPSDTAGDTIGAHLDARSAARDGFVVGVANPKAIVFFAAILPQYVNPQGAPAQLQMLLLGLIFVVIALFSDGVWGLAAGTARAWFGRSPRRMARIGALGGTVMIGLGLQLAVPGRKA